MLKNLTSLALKFFGALVSYLLTLYISRVFGNEKLGYFSFLLSLALIFLLILKLGTDTYTMKWTSKFYASGEYGKAKFLYFKILRYHLIAGSMITGIVIVTIPWLLNQFFRNYSDTSFFEIGLISVFFINLHILNYEFLRGTQRIISYTFYHTVSIFLFTILTLFLLGFLGIQSGRNLEISYLCAAFLSFCMSAVEVSKKSMRHQTATMKHLQTSSIIRESAPFFSNNIVFVLIGTMDIFILSRYVSPTTIGEYALILKIATFISFPLTVMSANFAPRIASFSNQETLKREIVRTGKMILFGAILVFGSLFVLFPFLTNFLHIRNSAGLPVFLLIGTGYLVSSFFSLNETCLVMLGEEKRYQKIMIFACVINLILNLLLIPVLKETGAATASMLTLIIWNVAAAYYTNKKLRLPTGITF